MLSIISAIIGTAASAAAWPRTTLVISPWDHAPRVRAARMKLMHPVGVLDCLYESGYVLRRRLGPQEVLPRCVSLGRDIPPRRVNSIICSGSNKAQRFLRVRRCSEDHPCLRRHKRRPIPSAPRFNEGIAHHVPVVDHLIAQVRHSVHAVAEHGDLTAD